MLAGVHFLHSSLNDRQRFLLLDFRHVKQAARGPHVARLISFGFPRSFSKQIMIFFQGLQFKNRKVRLNKM
jgi:hypothetical protein